MTNPVGNNLVLVGMPGAGKSTIGLLLAKELVMDFVDTDLLIQQREGKSLQDIIHDFGFERLRQIEEEVLLSTDFTNHVIATGGSAVYSEAGMNYLKEAGRVVFLDVPLAELGSRVHNYASRGIACPPGQTMPDLYDERQALYRKYADLIIDCRDKSPYEVVSQIIYSEAEQFAEVDA